MDETTQTWHQRNREKLLTYNKEYYAENREAILARNARYNNSAKGKAKKAAYNKAYYVTNADARRTEAKAYYRRNYHKILKRIYGLTKEQYEALLLKQDGKCAICLGPPTKGKRLCVDHDHKTGLVRGLLCHDCNIAIGKFKESEEIVQRASLYLMSPIDLKLQ
jgi:hypothetical protein